MATFAVYVDDNFHYQDEDERYQLGTFASYDEAVAACRRIVDDFLALHFTPGMSADDLFRQYTGFGEDPFVSPDEHDPRFSAWTYARQRCQHICEADT
jgi:hypothetical protein